MDGEGVNVNEHLKNGNYLPKPLKDFHDQKTVFKCVDEIAQRYAEKHRATVPSWIDGISYANWTRQHFGDRATFLVHELINCTTGETD